MHTVGDVIVISARAGELIHYYLAKKGRAAIYMATYAPALLPVGELRFVARLNANKLPKADRGTDSNGNAKHHTNGSAYRDPGTATKRGTKPNRITKPI